LTLSIMSAGSYVVESFLDSWNFEWKLQCFFKK
jgi:hypothetical protein